MKKKITQEEFNSILGKAEKKVEEERIEELMIDESIAYLCGVKDASEKIIPYSRRAIYNKILENEIKYESLRLSNPKYDIPLKELERIAGYM